MVAPSLRPRIEEERDFASVLINGTEVGPFVAVTVKAGVGEIL